MNNRNMCAVVLVLILTGPVHAQTQRFFEESQALTRALPTTSPVSLPTSATKPLLLTGYNSFRLWVCPISGAAITGGKVRFHVFNVHLQKWGYNESLDVTLRNSSVDRCQITGFRVDVPQGYLLPATMGVTVTSGTVVTLLVEPGKV